MTTTWSQLAVLVAVTGGSISVAGFWLWFRIRSRNLRQELRRETKVNRDLYSTKRLDQAARLLLSAAKAERRAAESEHRAAEAERRATEAELRAAKALRRSINRMTKLFQDHYGDVATDSPQAARE